MEQNKNNCKKCKHTWIARIEKPQQCPRCKSYEWELTMTELKSAARIAQNALDQKTKEVLEE